MQKREIKFRAWYNEQMVYWNLSNMYASDTGELKADQYCQVTDLTNVLALGHFMQFTGLLDKNGVEIYEGDIVKYDVYQQGRDDVIKKTDIVKYKDYGFEPFIYHTIIDQDDWYNYELENFEVIGNIYENPELL